VFFASFAVKVLVLKNLKPQRTPRFFAKERKVDENKIWNIVIGYGLKVHSALGPGLLESSYAACLSYELVVAGLFVEAQKPLPLIYESVKLECGYRIDLMVERKLIIEIKAVEALNDLHLAQTLTYLKLSGCRLGLLMNFNVIRLKDGIRRVINNL
jgi:GxxExxY protein